MYRWASVNNSIVKFYISLFSDDLLVKLNDAKDSSKPQFWHFLSSSSFMVHKCANVVNRASAFSNDSIKRAGSALLEIMESQLGRLLVGALMFLLSFVLPELLVGRQNDSSVSLRPSTASVTTCRCIMLNDSYSTI